VPGLVNTYALLQLLVTTGVGTALLFVSGLTWPVTAAIVGLMLLAMVCTGYWLDGRRPLGLELLRLGLSGVMLATAWQLSVSAWVTLPLTLYLVANLLVLPGLAQASLRLPGLATR
jgi:hypothetical protein